MIYSHFLFIFFVGNKKNVKNSKVKIQFINCAFAHTNNIQHTVNKYITSNDI